MTDHCVQLPLVQRGRFQVAFLDTPHASGFGDAPLASLAAHQHAQVGFAILDAGIGDAHIVDAHEARRAGGQQQLVPQALLRGNLHRRVALQSRELRRIEPGLRVHIGGRLLHDGRQLRGAHARRQRYNCEQDEQDGAHHEPPDDTSG
jgi:hypothetical protein